MTPVKQQRTDATYTQTLAQEALQTQQLERLDLLLRARNILQTHLKNPPIIGAYNDIAELHQLFTTYGRGSGGSSITRAALERLLVQIQTELGSVVKDLNIEESEQPTFEPSFGSLFAKLPDDLACRIFSVCEATPVVQVLCRSKRFRPLLCKGYVGKEITYQALTRHPERYAQIDPNVPAKTDSRTLEAVIRTNPSLFFHLPDSLQMDSEMKHFAYLSAVFQKKSALCQELCEKETGDKVLSKTVSLCGFNQHIIQNHSSRDHAFAPLLRILPQLGHNRDIVLAALRLDRFAFQYIHASLRCNHAIALNAIRRDGYALELVGATLKSDKELVLTAVTNKGLALQHAHPDLQADREIVIAAIRQNGLALQFASDAIKSNPNVALEAVRQNGLALQFASDRIKNDRTVALEAVRQNDFALQFVSATLQDDQEVVINAIHQNADALIWASNRLQQEKPRLLAQCALLIPDSPGKTRALKIISIVHDLRHAQSIDRFTPFQVVIQTTPHIRNQLDPWLLYITQQTSAQLVIFQLLDTDELFDQEQAEQEPYLKVFLNTSFCLPCDFMGGELHSA